MNVLIVDHNFQYDIEALCFANTKHEIRVWPAQRLAKIAGKYFPKEIFSSILGEEYSNEIQATARKKYLHAARKILHAIYKQFHFDCIVSPSDTIFYLRAWVEVARELGIPFIVLQKETSISPYSMIEDSRVIGLHLPFISDLMLVCSEHHKQFWINSGADGRKITVTGQPRFDFYSNMKASKQYLDSSEIKSNKHLTVLYFSYDLGAYSREGVLANTWLQLRTETEAALVDLAKAGICTLIIKPHPQQQNIDEYRDYLSLIAGELFGKSVQLVHGSLDARELIISADIVVGFQTTALFESLGAGKSVIYTYWSSAVTEYLNDLLPFHDLNPRAINVATSAKDLKEKILSIDSCSKNGQQHGMIQVETLKQLGPIDGKASERCWNAISNFTKRYELNTSQLAQQLRKGLTERARSNAHYKLMLTGINLYLFSLNCISYLLDNLFNQFDSAGSNLNNSAVKRMRNKLSEYVEYVNDDAFWYRKKLRQHISN